MTKKAITFLALFTLPIFLLGQQVPKRVMDHSVFNEWRFIKNEKISNDGQWVVYDLTIEEHDPELVIRSADQNTEWRFPRGAKGQFSNDSRYVFFTIHPPVDSVKTMRRKKVKKDKLPTDTLAIFNLATQEVERIPDLKSFKIPKKWDGWLAYKLDKPRIEPKDSTREEEKKWNKDLVIRTIDGNFSQQVPDVNEFVFAKDGQSLLLSSEGQDSTFMAGVYYFAASNRQLRPLFRGKGKYKKLDIDKAGQQAAFLADLDSTETRIRPYGLYHWQSGPDSARLIMDNTHTMLPEQWQLSANRNLQFSDNGQRLFFGIAPPLVLQDTTLLKEEIVEVEVWHWEDARLYPQQKVRLKNEKERSYLCVWHRDNAKFAQLGRTDIPEIRLTPEKDSRYALGYNELPYLSGISWDGFPSSKDVYRVDLETGEATMLQRKVRANPAISPGGQFLFWYNNQDTCWQTVELSTQRLQTLTNNQVVPFYDELNDRPMLPGSYGIAGWLEGDAALIVNDRYDLWQLDPRGRQVPRQLTNGRADQLQHRYLRLDPEAYAIDPAQAGFLYLFNEKSKDSGYGHLNWQQGNLNTIAMEAMRYRRRPLKARDADRLLFTKENFDRFPNLMVANLELKNAKQLSNANPQQAEYRWGSIELVEWTDLNGEQLSGMLVKPENFDPNRKYPMIVNFYERSSNRLHQHRAPYPHRSTINYSFYANQGYLIFNPDVPYRVGYPGESAYNAVMPGVTALINQGFVDEARIALQGHSWGGYQVAYLITKTNLFRCAESGAPVVNMFSAYGGIRWGSGLSRMFQYENTQSRIGGTIWDTPLRYLENSPLFFLDKVETPVLILHNDKDGAVPWYQGIEFFVAMRRLGKPAWMLNYNDEPHWPVKRQNRLDFNLRMHQFFDYYLKDAPMPQWMEKGVPATEKGIRQGLELMTD